MMSRKASASLGFDVAYHYLTHSLFLSQLKGPSNINDFKI